MKIHVQVNPTDIPASYITTLNNPISHAVQKATGKMWYVFDGTSIRQMVSPLQPIALPGTVARWWRQYRDLGAAPPIEFDLDIQV
jgi:hypothetical protein